MIIKKRTQENRKKNDLLDVAIGIIKSIYLPSKPQGATDVRLLALLIENDFFFPISIYKMNFYGELEEKKI